jgi:hypothetical protein
MDRWELAAPSAADGCFPGHPDPIGAATTTSSAQVAPRLRARTDHLDPRPGHDPNGTGT